MTVDEKYYANKYEHPGFELSKHCSGTGCCSTCMYRKVDQSFQNDYCLDKKKEGTREMNKYNIFQENLKDGTTGVMIEAKNEVSALLKYKKGLMTIGFYSLIRESGKAKLTSSFGAVWVAVKTI